MSSLSLFARSIQDGKSSTATAEQLGTVVTISRQLRSIVSASLHENLASSASAFALEIRPEKTLPLDSAVLEFERAAQS